MPIYEYRCKQCLRKFSLFVHQIGSPEAPVCDACGSVDLDRLMSRFAHHRSEAERLSDLDTSKQPQEDYYRDSRNIGLWAKKRAKELGLDDALQPKLDEIVDNAKSKVNDLLAD